MISKTLLGNAIRLVRDSRKLTQEQLARGAGLTANTVARIERGECLATESSLEVIAEQLGISTSVLTILAVDEASLTTEQRKLLTAFKKSITMTFESQIGATR